MPFPDSPEAVALALFLTIIGRDQAPQSNISPSRYLLDLFGECIKAVRSEREDMTTH